MKAKDFKELTPGLYRIHWKKSWGGGQSLAAIGRYWGGTTWFAPTDWTVGAAVDQGISKNIEKIELIVPNPVNVKPTNEVCH